MTSTASATLAIWTIARFAALAVLGTEVAFFLVRRRDPSPRPPAHVFWALTPAVILLGLCFWCASAVSGRAAPYPAVAQLAR
ncbi:MAG TPA: hypothetical protein VMK66_15625 [Myxococcales bacterium]|nr:hypothetical protein [Myxococcales bacterium]